MSRATVQLVKRGEQHPYVIEVMTPGWRGVDYLDGREIQRTMPEDLREIRDLLENAGVKYGSVTEPTRQGVMVFINDGATEFVLRDAHDFEVAITVLFRAGWLSEVPFHPTVQ